MTSKPAIAALAVLTLSAMGASAQAKEFVQNGGFEDTLVPGTSEFGDRFPTQQVTNWSTNSYSILITPGTGDVATTNIESGSFSLWGPKNGANNGLTDTSPAGGNYVASDPVFAGGPITQDIIGLQIGQTYDLSFWWAGAQQEGFNGPTTEGWDVSLGDSAVQSVGPVNNVDHGFTGWQLAHMSFVADSTTETLKFLATGSPGASFPPFALLDGVSLTGGGVPEPAAWALMILGFGGVGAAVRRRRAMAATA